MHRNLLLTPNERRAFPVHSLCSCPLPPFHPFFMRETSLALKKKNKTNLCLIGLSCCETASRDPQTAAPTRSMGTPGSCVSGCSITSQYSTADTVGKRRVVRQHWGSVAAEGDIPFPPPSRFLKAPSVTMLGLARTSPIRGTHPSTKELAAPTPFPQLLARNFVMDLRAPRCCKFC